MEKRLHLYYSGSVQGVGFRYTAADIARSLRIKGWVRNLSDGRVEAVCEGSEPDLKSFMAKVDDAFNDYIRDVESLWSAASGEFEEFDIRF